jgi:FSR family fosmidomycin resistance protein-like MFS transporter
MSTIRAALSLRRIGQFSRVQSPSVRTLFALVLAHALLDSYGTVWPIFKKLANLNLVWAGLIVTVATSLTAATQPLFGIWADRGHRRQFILLGTALATAGMLLGPLGIYREALGEVWAYLLMFLVMLVVRFGQAMFHPAGASVAGGLVEGHRSTLVALFIAGGMMGFGTGQMIFSAAYQQLDGHTEYLLLPAALLFIFLYRWCRPRQTDGHQPLKLKETLAGLAHVRLPLFILYLILVLLSAQTIGFYFLLPEFLELRGYPTWMVNGGGVLLFVIGSVLIAVPAGRLSDRFGRFRVLAAILVLMLVSYYVLLLAPSMPVAAFAGLCIITGGFIGTGNPMGVALGQQLLPHSASVVSGILMGLAWSVGGTAPAIVACLAQIESLGLIGALAMLGAANVLAIVLAMCLPFVARRVKVH